MEESRTTLRVVFKSGDLVVHTEYGMACPLLFTSIFTNKFGLFTATFNLQESCIMAIADHQDVLERGQEKED